LPLDFIKNRNNWGKKMKSYSFLLDYFLMALLAIFFGCAKTDEEKSVHEDQYSFEGEKHLKNLQMLTTDGENAEAYFSFDEKQLIFQTTFGHLQCDQIFTMSTDGSEKKMVSMGKGRTTCAYFLPGDETLVYASTHLADENCPLPPDRSHGYVWQLYDSYDIFLADKTGRIIKQMTNSSGYDAEATVSPKGDKIVFTSTRDGDPEIYTMDLDGSSQTRLTFERGYDGGPFFSWDGSKIVFRASRPQTEKELQDYELLVNKDLYRPTALEIFVMDADGQNMQQVTNFGKASFAPFFHPDNKRIIFSSNINSETGRNFDLYMINVDGSRFEQITFNDTFDGFPMFTRDGERLVFASNRFNKKQGDTNIFIADWVD
jgi:Tol biopolymer transport system component